MMKPRTLRMGRTHPLTGPVFFCSSIISLFLLSCIMRDAEAAYKVQGVRLAAGAHFHGGADAGGAAVFAGAGPDYVARGLQEGVVHVVQLLAEPYASGVGIV